MFITGKPVTGENFLDRKNDVPLFKTYLDNNQSIMIKAPRRFGKTSIVKHLLENKSNNFVYIYIDVKSAITLKSLADTIINHTYALLGLSGFLEKARKSIFDIIKSVSQLTIKADDIAEATIKFIEKGDVDEMEYYLHALTLIEKVAEKKSINTKFVLDEFQDILKIANTDILDKSRSIMQHHNNVTYIFLGSIESIMTHIFENKASAFYHFAKIIRLAPFDIEEIVGFAENVFNNLGVIYPDKFKEYIALFKGHPDYTIQYLQKLYINVMAYNKKELSREFLQEMFIQTVFDNGAYIDELISKAKQKKHHIEVLASIARDTTLALDSKSLYNVRCSLEDMGLIVRIRQGEYSLNDVILEFILRYGRELESLDFNSSHSPFH